MSSAPPPVTHYIKAAALCSWSSALGRYGDICLLVSVGAEFGILSTQRHSRVGINTGAFSYSIPSFFSLSLHDGLAPDLKLAAEPRSVRHVWMPRLRWLCPTCSRLGVHMYSAILHTRAAASLSANSGLRLRCHESVRRRPCARWTTAFPRPPGRRPPPARWLCEDRADRRRQIRTLGFAQRERPIRPATRASTASSIAAFVRRRARRGASRGAARAGCRGTAESDKG